MLDPSHPIAKLLKQDPRYKVDAYAFVFESLAYAHKVLGLGAEQPSEEEEPKEAESEQAARDKHLSGQQLCEAIRLLAMEQFGYMAKCVLNSWGVYSTRDFGEIVFNLIHIGQMKKTKEDRREDFDNVFDFETGLRESFRIDLPKT